MSSFINSHSENAEIPNWVCNKLILEQILCDCSTDRPSVIYYHILFAWSYTVLSW